VRWTEAILLGLACLLAPAVARSDAADVQASMSCAIEAGSGRLLCTVVFVSSKDRELSWTDAVVVSAPPSARPLRARVASARGAPEKILIGFVLSSGGGGRIEVRARAVTCPQAPRGGACRPETRLVAYELTRPEG